VYVQAAAAARAVPIKTLDAKPASPGTCREETRRWHIDAGVSRHVPVSELHGADVGTEGREVLACGELDEVWSEVRWKGRCGD